jgi:hypothetical protein
MNKNNIHPIFSDIIKNKTYLVLIDPYINENNGYLRSVPLIERLSGYSLKTMITWEAGQNCKNPLNMCHNNLLYKLPIDSQNENHFLGVAVNSEEDEKTNYIQRMIDCPTPRVFITDNCDYVARGWIESYLPLTQRSQVPPLFFSTELSPLLKQDNLESYVLPETKNLAFIELAFLYHKITGKKNSNLASLFDYHSEMTAILPIWDWALNLIELKKQNAVADKPTFVFNALRPWIEHNMHVNQVRDKLYELLESVRFKAETLRNERQKLLKSDRSRLEEIIRTNEDPTFQRLIRKQMERIQW